MRSADRKTAESVPPPPTPAGVQPVVPATGIVCELLRPTPRGLARMFESGCGVLESVGMMPTHVAYTGLHKYRDFKRARAGLKELDFGAQDFISVRHVSSTKKSPTIEFAYGASFEIARYEHKASLYKVAQHLDGFYKMSLTFRLPPAAVDQASLDGVLMDFLKKWSSDYGYMFRMRPGSNTAFYACGTSTEGDFSSEEAKRDVQAWGGNHVHFHWCTLRSVFPMNVLSPRQLGLKVGRKSLGSWIRAEPARRGRLEVVSGESEVRVWTPPPKRIPEIREELFRAGVIFHRSFFNSHLKEECPGPTPTPEPLAIPEHFRAARFGGGDPTWVNG